MELWFAAVFSLFLACLWYLYRSSKAKNSPPGPRGLPLIGHLHLLGDFPHHNLQKLAIKHGPIMSIRLGFVPAVIISSPEYAELFLKTHDVVFASRPKLQVSDFLSYGHKNLVFAKYGPYWRNIRRLCTIELLSHSKIEALMPMRVEEINEFTESLKKAEKDGSVVDITVKIESLIEGMTYRMLFGSKEDKGDFKTGLLEAIGLIGHFNLADYVPYIGVLDIQVIYHFKFQFSLRFTVWSNEHAFSKVKLNMLRVLMDVKMYQRKERNEYSLCYAQHLYTTY